MTTETPDAPTIAFWGTFDTGKPRVKNLVEGARAAGYRVLTCHASLWEGVADKSQLGIDALLIRLIRWAAKYPGLLWRYLRLPPHDVVCVLYMGQVDVLVLWLASRLRGVPLVWDMFISLYDTVVNDRELVDESSLGARLLYALEWLGCRAADKVIIDTATHARFVEETFGLPPDTVGRVFIGTDPESFAQAEPVEAEEMPEERFNVLFFGQFIPLHGIDTIIEAARLIESADEGTAIRWILAGTGQEQPRIDEKIRKLGLESIVRKEWIPHHDIPRWIKGADLCLGILGGSGKALRVIPNKVFEIIAARRPFITADTAAIRELGASGACDCMMTVPPADAPALARKVREFEMTRRGRGAYTCASHMPVYGPDEVGEQLRRIIQHTTNP